MKRGLSSWPNPTGSSTSLCGQLAKHLRGKNLGAHAGEVGFCQLRRRRVRPEHRVTGRWRPGLLKSLSSEQPVRHQWTRSIFKEPLARLFFVSSIGSRNGQVSTDRTENTKSQEVQSIDAMSGLQIGRRPFLCSDQDQSCQGSQALGHQPGAVRS